MKDQTKNIGKVNSFFLFCSGASTALINKCPQYEVNKYVSIGITIVFTTLLSSLSAFFAFNLIFESIAVVIGASIIWGGMIFNLDRYIVSTMRSIRGKKGEFLKAIPRLIIAILIAIVISKPIEIKLFKDEINTYFEKEKIELIAQTKLKYEQPIQKVDNRKDVLIDKLEKKIAIREEYYQDYKCECEGSCGTGKPGRGRECESRQKKYESFALEVENLRNDINRSLEKLEQEKSDLINEQNSEMLLVANEFEPGFFDRVTTLNKINPIASFLILLIFIMVEISPILTKLLSQKGPYETLIEQTDLSYEINLEKKKDAYKQDRLRNQQLSDMNYEIELEQKRSELHQNLELEAIARYKRMQNKINDNL